MKSRYSTGSRLLVACAVAYLFAFHATSAVGADTGAAPSVAPANPRFVTYLEDVSAGKAQETTEEGRALGLVPPPVKLPAPEPGKLLALQSMGLVGLPATYDLRTQNKLTPVRDQGSCGACWAFASYGSMESSLKPSEIWDFSENNMKNTTGYDLTCCAGGNSYMAAAYLARWDGPVLEADDPYNAWSCGSPSGLTARKHIQAVDFVPDRTGPLDNDGIKQAVMTYGAVYTTLYWGGSYFNSSTNSYYYAGATAANHAVCVVGWDDNYDRNNFLTAPPGNGAFIMRNSWGPIWGSSGYFYISYYDSKIGIENAVFRGAESTTNYEQVYQHDPLGWVESAGYSTNTAWFANVFTSLSAEELAAVSLYVAMPGSTYELSVYLDPTSGPVNPSGPATTQTGTITSAGYQTIALNQTVTLAAGQSFSAVIKLTTPGFNYPIPMESAVTGYSGGATASAGESYISSDGVSWSDLTSYYANSNVCLKAFAVNRAGLLVTPTTGLISTGPSSGPFTPSSRSYTLQNLGDADIAWSASKNETWIDLSATGGTLGPGGSTTLAVSVNSNALSLGEGVYTDTVNIVNETDGAGSTTRAVTLIIKDGTLSVSPTTSFAPSGVQGGPFLPQSQVYTLTNTGYGALNWTASKGQSWIGLSAASGVLDPGANVNVTVSVTSDANTLSTGDYFDTVSFANTTNGNGDTYRSIILSVTRNYEMTATTYSWVDPSGHSTLLLSDDAVSGPQTIPFTFSFYGTAYTQVYVGANGLLGFASTGLSEYMNRDIPVAAAPNAVIYPYWDDLNPPAGGSVRIGTAGSYPNRKMVISWVGVPHYGSTSPLTFQVILCEVTSDIVLQYQEVQSSNMSFGAGRSATVGVENAQGSVARKYSYNGSTLLANGQAIRFTVNRSVTIAEAIRLASGVACSLSEVQVTAVPSVSQFYVEAEDRSAGIAIYKSYHGLAPYDVADVVGTVSTSTGGEKYISASTVAYGGGADIRIRPLVLVNRAIGGGDWFYDPITKAGQEGVKDHTIKGIQTSVHLNNIGLLITTTGKVTYSASGYFYIDDGSGAQDDSGHNGAKVLGSVPVGQGEDPVGRYVIVTGVSSTFRAAAPSTNLYRQIRATDIVVVN